MAIILLVEEDGLIAQHLARSLRQAGHTTLLARDGQSALREAHAADLILLDLRLPDRSWKEMLADLRRESATAHIPVLLLAGKAAASAFLRSGRQDQVAGLLLKPVVEADLLQGVSLALAADATWDPEALAKMRQRQLALIWRLIVEGPDPFVLQLCRRLSADREEHAKTPASSAGALGWSDLALWARQVGLLDEEQARLLACLPLPRSAPAATSRT